MRGEGWEQAGIEEGTKMERIWGTGRERNRNGTGTGGYVPVSFSYITSTLPPKHRKLSRLPHNPTQSLQNTENYRPSPAILSRFHHNPSQPIANPLQSYRKSIAILPILSQSPSTPSKSPSILSQSREQCS